MAGALAWTIAAAPNPGWATQVFGEPDVERLWDAVSVPLRLDEADVVGAWRAHRDLLERRAGALNALGLDAVRYYGDGTDLTVGLLPDALWAGGSLTTTSGVVTMPNLPTEEVFTSPDRARAEGTIRVTRPLVMPGTGALVEGLEARFEGGRIVDIWAQRGADVVQAQLETDDGARSLGEVALVDHGSRVRAAGVIFRDTLYDENAGSHVAWGQSFPFVLPNWRERSFEELFEAGLNRSAVHTDVVIGGPGVNVDGMTDAGVVVPLIADNHWVLPVYGPDVGMRVTWMGHRVRGRRRRRWDRVRGHRAGSSGRDAARVPRYRPALAQPGAGVGRSRVPGRGARPSRVWPVRQARRRRGLLLVGLGR